MAPFFSKVEAVGERLRSGSTPILRIGGSELVLRDHVPELLRHLRSRHPGLRVALRSGFQAAMQDALLAGELDLAIVPLEARPPAHVRCRSLVRLPLELLVPKAIKAKTAAELLAGPVCDHPLICLPPSESVSRLFRRGLEKRKLDWPVALEASSLDLIARYVSNGYGIGVSVSGGAPLREPGIRALPLPPPADERRATSDAQAVVDGVAVARLYGEPLFAMPTDLYIPPDALEVFLEAFEGPLDLLLYLIRRQNFNILDIPLASVTRQYLDYVDQIRKHNLELASEYLLMAAMLIEIKSRMLLPPKKSDDGSEPEDPRADLVRRLVEYEQIKLAAARLDALPLMGRDFLRAQVTIEQSLVQRLPEVHPDDLRQAWAEILQRAKLNQHHMISREQLSVREHMSIVLRKLQGRRFVEFQDLFDTRRGTPVLVVTFVAMLELSRESLIEVTQAEAFAPIYVRLAYAPS